MRLLLSILIVLLTAAHLCVGYSLSVGNYLETNKASASLNQDNKSITLLKQLQVILIVARFDFPSSYSKVSVTSLKQSMKGGAQNFKTPWGTDITISDAKMRSFRITIAEVPAEACSLLDTKVKDKINQRIFTDSTTCNPDAPTDYSFTVNRTK